jgi:putative transposase
LHDLQSAHKKWVEASLQQEGLERQSHWTGSIASGSKSFIEEVKNSLGFKAKGKFITGSKDHYQLREKVSAFGETSLHAVEAARTSDTGTTNTFDWREIS